MQIIQSTDYAIRAMLCLANQEDPEKPMTSSYIADTVCIPLRFLLKIMRQLTHQGLVDSHRGSAGGYTLARPAAEISLLDIIVAMEGPVYFNRCLDDPNLCNRQAADYCKVHLALFDVQELIKVELDKYSLADLIES